MKAAFLDYATVGSDELDLSPLEALTDELLIYDNTPADEAAARINGCEFVYINKVRMTREILESAGSLRFIGLLATGVDNVDLETARDRGIAVCNIRAYCTNSVVEHVFGVLLNIAHSIGQFHESVRRGEWQQGATFCMLDHPIRELAAMTIGIVGHGELGQGVARLASAFGMQVLISKRPGSPGDTPAGRLEFEDVLRKADVLSLHCPLTEETRNLIGAHELQLMKPSAILVNTARGALVDSGALVDALRTGTISAAAIDVLRVEPPVDGDPLLDYRGNNLIVTPHIAWATSEARQNAVNEVAANVRAFLSGGDRNRVV
jgi:glycerate dehydrogenase